MVPTAGLPNVGVHHAGARHDHDTPDGSVWFGTYELEAGGESV